MTDEGWQPDLGDLFWTDFLPTKGREQACRRPALVVSSKVFPANTGLVVVCPITSHVRPFPTSVVLQSGLPVEREILTSHIRSIDMLTRRVLYAGATIGTALTNEVRAKLAAFITI